LNYRETLFFIAKCLTISLEDNNRQEIEKQLQSDTIDWDAVVKVSTSHYVFPALYCNLKRVNFLKYVPEDLLGYMAHITELNRERNLQIIKQAKELNKLLLANNLTPIFLKGTGNLLEGLYDDIAERMVGDIDFIINKNHTSSTKIILSDYGYKTSRIMPPSHRHESTLINENYIAAVEVHTELLIEKYRQEFQFDLIYKEIQEINGVMVLSFDHQLALSIISQQINDFGYEYKTIALRNAYDVFLFSKKTNAKAAVNTLDKLANPLNCFLAACYDIFNSVESLEYVNTKKTASYLGTFNSQFTNRKTTKIRHKFIKTYLFLKIRLNILYKSIIYKEYRVWLFKRVTDKNWYKEKLIQLGIKKEDLPNNSCLLHK
jgi:hypothetical protein